MVGCTAILIVFITVQTICQGEIYPFITKFAFEMHFTPRSEKILWAIWQWKLWKLAGLKSWLALFICSWRISKSSSKMALNVNFLCTSDEIFSNPVFPCGGDIKCALIMITFYLKKKMMNMFIVKGLGLQRVPWLELTGLYWWSTRFQTSLFPFIQCLQRFLIINCNRYCAIIRNRNPYPLFKNYQWWGRLRWQDISTLTVYEIVTRGK